MKEHENCADEKNNVCQKTNPQKSEKDKRFYRRMHRVFAGMFRIIFRVRVSGREKIPTEGGCVVCINHVGAPDVIAVSAVSPRQLCYLAKAELFKIPLLGTLIRRLGAYPLDRSGSDVGALRRSVALIEAGEAVAIFPQGHRQPGKNPADTPFRAGAAMIAHRAKCPILPVCVRMKKMRYAPFRRVEVIVGDLIAYECLGLEEEGRAAYASATKLVFDEICRLGGFLTDASATQEAEK